MERRNLAARKDIAGDVLRQRRDLYAVSIGLALFHLAGGSLGNESNFSGILPLRFDNPCLFLWAAWIAFFYFFLRYRLLAPPAFRMYWQEAMWQAGNLPMAREIAALQIVHAKDATAEANQRHRIRKVDGPVPVLEFVDGHFRPRLRGLKERGDSGDVGSYGQEDRPPLTTSQRRKLWLAAIYGLTVSSWRERSFSDYVLPYLFAAATLVIASIDLSFGRSHLCVPW